MKIGKVETALKMMETFMYFWLNYSNEDNRVERIPVALAVK